MGVGLGVRAVGVARQPLEDDEPGRACSPRWRGDRTCDHIGVRTFRDAQSPRLFEAQSADVDFFAAVQFVGRSRVVSTGRTACRKRFQRGHNAGCRARERRLVERRNARRAGFGVVFGSRGRCGQQYSVES